MRIIDSLRPHPVSDHDPRFGIGDALFHVKRTLPRSLRFGQFRFGVSALGKHPNGFSCGQMLRISAASRAERCDRAGSDHVELSLDAFDLAHATTDRARAERFDDPVEKLGAQAARLDQGHRALDQAGDHNSRQARRPSRCRPRTRRACGSNRTSCAESRMWRSHSSSERRRGNQVLAPRSPPAAGRIGLEPFECFT